MNTMASPAVNAALANNVAPRLLRSLIDEIARLRQHWKNTPELEQKQVIDRLRIAVEDAVSRAAVIIAADGNVRFAAKIEGVTSKNGSIDSCKLELVDATHDLQQLMTTTSAVLVLVDIKQHLEGMETVKPEPDQPSLLPDDEPTDADGDEGDGSETTTAEATTEL